MRNKFEKSFESLANRKVVKYHAPLSQPPLLNIVIATEPYAVLIALISSLLIFSDIYHSYFLFSDFIGIFANIVIFVVIRGVRNGHIEFTASIDRDFNRIVLAILCPVISSCKYRFGAAIILGWVDNVDKASSVSQHLEGASFTILAAISQYSVIAFFVVSAIGLSIVYLLLFPKDVNVLRYHYRVKEVLHPIIKATIDNPSRIKTDLSYVDGNMLSKNTNEVRVVQSKPKKVRQPQKSQTPVSQSPKPVSTDYWETQMIDRKSRNNDDK